MNVALAVSERDCDSRNDYDVIAGFHLLGTPWLFKFMPLSNISHPLRLKVARISVTGCVHYSTKLQRIFADSKSAEFIAGAASAANIPELRGLSEVRQSFPFFELYAHILGRS